MPVSKLRRLAVCVGLVAGCAQAASAADILIGDAKSGPESLTIAPGGVLIVGSANTPFVYKARAGATTAEKFIDVSAEGPGTIFLGMLADAASNTLWTCQLTPVAGSPMQRKSALRGFNLDTGAPKIRWDLPGDSNVCNDFSVGPDKALYVTDTGNAKIFRLPAGASTADLFLEDRAALAGIDGITFLNGTLYVNNVRTNKIYRVPVDGAGKAAPAVEIILDQPLKGPDGMRAANGKLLVAENGAGKISSIAVTGDKGIVTVIKEGLNTPTAVEPAGDTIWIAERGTGKAVSIPMPK